LLLLLYTIMDFKCYLLVFYKWYAWELMDFKLQEFRGLGKCMYLSLIASISTLERVYLGSPYVM